jgi:hypothetical protein
MMRLSWWRVQPALQITEAMSSMMGKSIIGLASSQTGAGFTGGRGMQLLGVSAWSGLKFGGFEDCFAVCGYNVCLVLGCG